MTTYGVVEFTSKWEGILTEGECHAVFLVMNRGSISDLGLALHRFLVSQELFTSDSVGQRLKTPGEIAAAAICVLRSKGYRVSLEECPSAGGEDHRYQVHVCRSEAPQLCKVQVSVTGESHKSLLCNGSVEEFGGLVRSMTVFEEEDDGK